LTKWGFVPTGDFESIEMQDDRQGIEFVQAWHDAAILDVRQAADVQDKVWTATVDGNLVAGSFNITIGEAERFASLS